MTKIYIDKISNKDFIRSNILNFTISIFIIKKPDGELQIYINYRTLNILTIKNRNTFPFIKNILIKLCYTKIYIKFNIIIIFNIIKIHKKNKKKIAFITRYKLYEYTIIFFDLYNVFEIF